jgi:glucose-induced degradation protein 8
MAVSNTSSTSSTSEPHALTPIHHTATKAEWMDAIEQQRLERSTLNRLIINYLVTGTTSERWTTANAFLRSRLEGFKEAAEKFAEEAGISLNHVDLTSLDERLRIREAIECGRIEEAIDLINKKAPELLDQNRQLAFHLKVT